MITVNEIYRRLRKVRDSSDTNGVRDMTVYVAIVHDICADLEEEKIAEMLVVPKTHAQMEADLYANHIHRGYQ